MKASSVLLLFATISFAPIAAGATNIECQESKLDLPPIYNTLQMRLREHLHTRENDLKITVEQDLSAYLVFAQIADRYDKRMDNAIRAYDDGDPEAKRICRALVLSANCEAYRVYQDVVIGLPGIDREAVLAEGRLRCVNAQTYDGFSFHPRD